MPEIKRYINPRVLSFKVDTLVEGLNLIPALSTKGKGYASSLELELFDKPRKSFLDGLSRIARQQAEQRIDPSPTIEATRPFISHLFSTFDQLGVMIDFIETNAGFGNDPQSLVDSAVQLIKGVSSSSIATEHYAKVGEVLARIDRRPQALAMFALADTNLGMVFEEAGDNGLGQVCSMSVVENVVRAKLKAGYTGLARHTLDMVPWDDIKEFLKEDLLPEIEEAEKVN